MPADALRVAVRAARGAVGRILTGTQEPRGSNRMTICTDDLPTAAVWCDAHPPGERRLSEAAKARIIDRDRCCMWCSELGRTLLLVDHIEPIADGGSDCPSNLQALCPTCHSIKTKFEATRRARREIGRRRLNSLSDVEWIGFLK